MGHLSAAKVAEVSGYVGLPPGLAESATVLAFGLELLDMTPPGADADSALWSMRKHADLELWCTPGRRDLAVAYLGTAAGRGCAAARAAAADRRRRDRARVSVA